MGWNTLIIKTLKINKKTIISIILLLIAAMSIMIYTTFANSENSENNDTTTKSKDFIKWVYFNVTVEALNLTSKLDIDSHNKNEEIKYNWIELLAYLACKNGGDFKNFKKSDLDALIGKLKCDETMESLTQDLKFYNYYYESYSAVLSGFIGNYAIDK